MVFTQSFLELERDVYKGLIRVEIEIVGNKAMGVPYHYRPVSRRVFCSNVLLMIRRPTPKYVSQIVS